MQPIPCGHHILIKPRSLEDVDENYASAKRSGIILTKQTQRQEQIAISVGQVLALGKHAFKDSGDGSPWCKVGDWVAYARHGGMFIEEPTDDFSGYLVLNDIDVVAIVGESND